jgi:hypothetical protein
MKSILVMFIGFSLLAAGCKKKNTEIQYNATGVLTGVDLALCACCGGIILKNDVDGKSYRIESLPGLSAQQLNNLNFPVKIKYNATVSRDCAGIVYLNIKAYQFF